MILCGPHRGTAGGEAMRRKAARAAAAEPRAPAPIRPADPAAVAEAAARCRRLWAAVLHKALDDARRTTDDGDAARAFLASEACERVCEAVGVDPSVLRDAAARLRPKAERTDARRARLAALVAAAPGLALADALRALVAEGAIAAHEAQAVRSWIKKGVAGVRVVRVRLDGRNRLRLEPEEGE